MRLPQLSRQLPILLNFKHQLLIELSVAGMHHNQPIILHIEFFVLLLQYLESVCKIWVPLLKQILHIIEDIPVFFELIVIDFVLEVHHIVKNRNETEKKLFE